MPDPQTRPTPYAPRVVALKRLRCPQCRSTNYRTMKTTERTAERIERQTKCRDCQFNFTVVID